MNGNLQGPPADVDREKIMEKYGLRDQEAYQRKVERVAEILRITKAEAVRFLLAVRR